MVQDILPRLSLFGPLEYENVDFPGILICKGAVAIDGVLPVKRTVNN